MTLCIYHHNCSDGFGAAWAVRKALGEIDFHAAVYRMTPPDVADRDVVIVDFSYKRPVLLEMASRARSILILDHHKTAQLDLTSLPGNIACTFDMDQSGAMLAWKHFHGVHQPPQLIQHIEDRDLWRFVLPHTREIHASISSYPYDFEVWNELMERPIPELIAEGTAIDRKQRKDVSELLSATQREMTIGGYRVPVANVPHMFASDAGSEMAQGEPFAACYWDAPDGRVFSLRSTTKGADVSAIAEQYGGGGHRNASGFKIPYDDSRFRELFAQNTAVAPCEATWVTRPDGAEQACGAPATRVVQFEDDTLLVCDPCAVDLSDFDLYWTERMLQGPRASLQSWTGSPGGAA